MKRPFYILIFSFFFACSLWAQSASCTISAIRFACPSKYFKEIRIRDPNVKAFKYTGEGNDLFFFMSVPTNKSDPSEVGKLIMSSSLKVPGGHFEWKPVINPLTMEIHTKYNYDLVAVMGLNNEKLVEVKAFVFDIKQKQIILGYVADWTDAKLVNRRLFEKGVGIGDNAEGCNQVVTALNSLTKEFRDRKQYCTLTVMGSPN